MVVTIFLDKFYITSSGNWLALLQGVRNSTLPPQETENTINTVSLDQTAVHLGLQGR